MSVFSKKFSPLPTKITFSLHEKEGLNIHMHKAELGYRMG
jgi:hypothetical protein